MLRHLKLLLSGQTSLLPVTDLYFTYKSKYYFPAKSVGTLSIHLQFKLT